MKTYIIYIALIILSIYIANSIALNLKNSLEQRELEQKVQIEAILNQ